MQVEFKAFWETEKYLDFRMVVTDDFGQMHVYCPQHSENKLPVDALCLPKKEEDD